MLGIFKVVSWNKHIKYMHKGLGRFYFKLNRNCNCLSLYYFQTLCNQIYIYLGVLFLLNIFIELLNYQGRFIVKKTRCEIQDIQFYKICFEFFSQQWRNEKFTFLISFWMEITLHKEFCYIYSIMKKYT